jgi:hypothetical protein
MDSIVSPKVKITKRGRVGRTLWLVTLRGRGAGWSSRMGLGRATSGSIIDVNLHKLNNKLVNAKFEHFWCMEESRANTNSQDSPQPKLEGSHHLPSYSILCAWPWDQHPNVILSQDSQVKFPKLGLLQLWRPINLCANLRLRWGLKQSCRPYWDLSNDMWHATCT